MKKVIRAAESLSAKLPYALQESPLDPVVLVLVLPLLLGYAAVILLANLL